MKKNIKINIFWNTFGSIFYSFCQWLITIIVVKMATYETAGYLSLAMTTSSSFSAIALFSMRNYQVSDISEEYTDDVYVGSRFLTSVLSFICCFFCVLFTSTVYQILCTLAFMIIRIVEAMVDVLHGIDQKYDRYDYIGISYIMRGILTVLFFIISLAVTGNLPFTLLTVAVFNLIAACFFDWRKTYSMAKFGVTVWNKNVLDLLKKCIPIVVFSFLLSLENLIPKSILQEELGAAQLGIYSSMASPTLVVQVFSMVAFSPFLPIISEKIHNGEKSEFKHILHKTYIVFVGLCIVVTIGAALLGKLGLKILFGESILQYYSIFMPIVWCTILTGIVWVLSSIIVALRRTKSLLIGMLIDFLLCLLLSRYLIRINGMNGVNIVQILVFSIYIVYMLIICERAEVKKGEK